MDEEDNGDSSTASPKIAETATTTMEPLSPASSSSASQTNYGDSTFEPTIDMIVNDFDDEQTLTEEEALAELEKQDPNDEIATLREESEMPLEDLLAKYKQFKDDTDDLTEYNQNSVAIKQTAKKSQQAKKKKRNKLSVDGNEDFDGSAESNEEENSETPQKAIINDNEENSNSSETATLMEIKDNNNQSHHQRRTHLMELYPENFLKMIETKVADNENADDYDIYEENDYEDEDDMDYAKKMIMVGSSFQAVIPTGLSKYGDVLPYENEDKLIWEPSQVSEKEVEDYLNKVKEIRASLSEGEQLDDKNKVDSSPGVNYAEQDSIKKLASCNILNSSSSSSSSSSAAHTSLSTNNAKGDSGEIMEGVISVKDNEQALHLLVQCGYDFKEALRRKRLNAVPLSGSMSLWSEDECKKFEEGIQKYGKDFLKIRQNQVRTRSMRELVQFYYLWKKSERRDQDFADSDTVDIMDMYLNEGEYNSASSNNSNHIANSGGLSGSNSFVNTKVQTSPMLVINNNNKLQSSECSSTSFQNKKLHVNVTTQKNFSIMNEAKQRSNSFDASGNKTATLKKQSNARRRINIEKIKMLSSNIDSQSAGVKGLRASNSNNNCK